MCTFDVFGIFLQQQSCFCGFTFTSSQKHHGFVSTNVLLEFIEFEILPTHGQVKTPICLKGLFTKRWCIESVTFWKWLPRLNFLKMLQLIQEKLVRITTFCNWFDCKCTSTPPLNGAYSLPGEKNARTSIKHISVLIMSSRRQHDLDMTIYDIFVLVIIRYKSSHSKCCTD